MKSESEVTQTCLTLSDPVDCSPPGSSIHGIFQARVPEWGAIAFSAMEYYSAIKKSELMPLAATWMDLEIVTLNEVSQTQKEYHIAHMWNKKGGTNETIYKTEVKPQM